jgi:hypothetical protein
MQDEVDVHGADATDDDLALALGEADPVLEGLDVALAVDEQQRVVGGKQTDMGEVLVGPSGVGLKGCGEERT